MNNRMWYIKTAPMAGFLRFCIAALACLAVRAGAAAEDQLQLLSVAPAQVPVITQNRVYYKVDFLFDRCPANCWWYYDPSGTRVVIEMYDYFVNVQDTLSIKPAPPVTAIECKNSSTPLVLSGKKSQIFLRLREEYHCEASCSNDTLRVVLWKELSALSKHVVRKKRRAPLIIVPALLVVFCAAMTVVYIRLSMAEK